MSELRERMNNAMLLRGLADRTRETYLACVTGLARFYRQSPDTLDATAIQAYLLHLITEKKLAYASVNQAACAFRFLFGEVLRKPAIWLDIPMAKVPKRLPLVLSRDEVIRLFAHCRNLRDRSLLETLYATGMRLSEVCALELSDIESAPDRMCIKVRQGKGERIGTPCSRRVCSSRFACIGGSIGRTAGYFRTAPEMARSTIRRFSACIPQCAMPPVCPKVAAFTRCAIASPPICSNPVWICRPSSGCSGMVIFQPPCAICISPKRA